MLMTTAGIGFSTCWIGRLTLARVFLYTLWWQLSDSVFQVFLNNVYMSTMPGEVNNLRPIAAQQDAF